MRPGGRGRRSTRENGRQVIVAGVLQTRRANLGGDPSTMSAKRPPNSRDGARCDAAFQQSPLSRSRFDRLLAQRFESTGLIVYYHTSRSG